VLDGAKKHTPGETKRWHMPLAGGTPPQNFRSESLEKRYLNK